MNLNIKSLRKFKQQIKGVQNIIQCFKDLDNHFEKFDILTKAEYKNIVDKYQ